MRNSRTRWRTQSVACVANSLSRLLAGAMLGGARVAAAEPALTTLSRLLGGARVAAEQLTTQSLASAAAAAAAAAELRSSSSK